MDIPLATRGFPTTRATLDATASAPDGVLEAHGHVSAETPRRLNLHLAADRGARECDQT
jgi:hypothetical protein